MSTIQNLKNFIRHGKQARIAPPPAEPTTNVSTTTIHAEQPRSHGKSLFTSHKSARNGNGSGAAAAAAADALQHDFRHDDGLASSSSSSAKDSSLPPDPVVNSSPPADAVAAASAASAAHQQSQPQSHAQFHQHPQQEQQSVPLSSKTKHESEIKQIVAEERQHSSTMPSYPGLERYRLLEKMGDGAFSNVYRARDSTGKYGEVAIKVVRKFEMNPKQKQNILKEVTIMRQLNHPNIVKLLEFSESPQFYYIILELCPGGELFHQIVRLTYFSEDLSRHVILQVAKAIEYLHEDSGVVHRDIKPENLLFYPIPVIPSRHPKPRQPGDEDKVDEGEFTIGLGGGGIGQVKVADFGLSKVIWDNQTMTPCGTVGYTAPEIVKDERYSKSVDMWALGCVLYTLLCGFPPFYDESIQVLTEKVARGQYTFLSPWWDDISKSAQDLVSHLLTVDPEKRYTIREFLSHPWITRSNEETYAAADAPPLATPMAVPTAPAASFMETPLAERRTMDFRSPGAINLREVFDVGYAVHRQEEEDKMRMKKGHAVSAADNGAFRAALNSLNEEDDDEEIIAVPVYETSAVPQGQQQKYQDDLADMEARLRSTNLSSNPPQQQQQARQPHHQVPQQQQQQPRTQPRTSQPSAAAQARYAPRQQPTSRVHFQPRQSQQQPQQQQQGYGSHSPAVAAIARENAARRARQPFELSLGNATLLEKRRKMHGHSANAATGGAPPAVDVAVSSPGQGRIQV